jgi:HK97 family phage prohead protease
MPQETRYGHSELQIRSVNAADRTIDFVASTFAKDSYGTRIDQNGWQFATKIPITWAHDDRGYTPSGGRPIGKAINLRVENGQLVGTAKFPRKGIFQFADECYDLAADGFIPATSVGFDPIETEMTMEGSTQVPVYRKARLLEIAFVTIPSNDEAQINARSRKLNRESEIPDIQKRLQQVEEMAKALEATPEPATPLPTEPMPADAAESAPEVKPEETPAEPAKETAPEVTAEPAPEVTPEVEAALPEAIERMAQKMTAEYVQKCISYFEKKQPVNKAATGVLKKFYQIRGESAPADESDAWQKMGEGLTALQGQLDAVTAQVGEMKAKIEQMGAGNVEDPKDPGNVESPNYTQSEETKEEGRANVEDPKAKDNVEHSDRAKEEEKEVTYTESSTVSPPAEAPQAPVQKASARIPLSLALKLRSLKEKQMRETAEEALRHGYPVSRLGEILAA